MVNRAVRVWSLKEKKLKSTMRGHTDEIEVIFLISSAKEFSVFSLHAEPLDVHLVMQYSDVNASFGILMIIWLPGYFVLPCHSSIPKSVISVPFRCSCTWSFSSACSLHCLSGCPMY